MRVDEEMVGPGVGDRDDASGAHPRKTEHWGTAASSAAAPAETAGRRKLPRLATAAAIAWSFSALLYLAAATGVQTSMKGYLHFRVCFFLHI